MIGVGYYNDENKIYLDINEGGSEYFYPLGHGILSILNFNLNSIDDMLVQYIRERISRTRIDENSTNLCFDNLKKELIKFNPYFACIDRSDIEKTITERFLRLLLEQDLFNGYSKTGRVINKENGIILPSLVAKDIPNPAINELEFIDCIYKLIYCYSGFIESDIGEKFINEINDKLCYPDDTTIWALYYYNKYINAHTTKSVFECFLPNSLEVKSVNLNIVKSDFDEFFTAIQISKSKVIEFSLKKLVDFKYQYLESGDNFNNFRNLEFVHDKNTKYDIEYDIEYYIESIYDLIFVEVLLMGENSIRITKCPICNNFIFYKQPKECNCCIHNDFKRKITADKSQYKKQLSNYVPANELKSRFYYGEIDKIIEKVAEYTEKNIITEKQYNEFKRVFKKRFKEYCEDNISEKYFISLLDKLNINSYWELASGDGNAINSLLEL